MFSLHLKLRPRRLNKLRASSTQADEEEFRQAHTISALVATIWRVKDSPSFDVGFRHAIINDVNINEVRADKSEAKQLVGQTVGRLCQRRYGFCACSRQNAVTRIDPDHAVFAPKAGICSKDYSNVIYMNGGEQLHSNLIQIRRRSIAVHQWRKCS